MSRALKVIQRDVLDNVQIASPCHMAWEDMTGTDRVRHCAACDKNVFNLSDMKRGEAINFVRATEGSVCVRFYRRVDGTMLTSDCPVGIAMLARRAKRSALAVVAASIGIVVTLLALFMRVPMPDTPHDVVDDVRTKLQVTKKTLERTRDELIVPERPYEHVAGGMPAPPAHEMGQAIVQ